jgi:hypothetical protein
MRISQIDDPDIKHIKSNASTNVSDIQNFIFGGINSRFWMLRKHFNSMSGGELCMLPFHSWHCISLEMSHREIDLVIKNEKDMDVFL